MVGRGCQCELGSQLHVFIFGLVLAYNTMFSSYAQASPGSCKTLNMTLMHQQCVSHKDGVHGLDCFGKYKSPKKTCVWKPGNYTSEKTYTLIIRQQSKIYCHINITRFSEDIIIHEKRNMTAEVFEVSKSTNCTKAVFSGSPKSMVQCDPPYHASFSRNSGGLDVHVTWEKEDQKIITSYAVRYKAQGSPMWNESLQQCQNGKRCTVKNLNSSLVYTMQIQCVSNYCSRCLWSKVYTVPPELTTHPVIVNLKDTDIAGKKGRRLLVLTWMFPAKELHDGYNVTISKASGEKPRRRLITTQPEIRLILSYSAFNVDISAINNASSSPAVGQAIPRRQDEPGLGSGRLKVQVHSNMSLTIYWKDNLIQQYVCYSAEWMTKGHQVAYKSFYQNKENSRELSPLPEPLDPYKRYSITLHTRPDKDTCNMKHINNSESTYGSTQFYFIEGSPVSAPANISSFNVTLHSMMLQWSSIPEEDLRGFLLGYVIYYSEIGQTRTSTERNITVSPEFNSCELRDLKSGTAYEVQVSGFTQAGEGVRSPSSLFKTNFQGYSIVGVVAACAVVATVLIFGPLIFKRAKVVLWPSIPHPGNSNAVQKIEGPCELELLESINTLEVEEWDSNSLQILEKEDVKPASTLAPITPLLHGSEDEEDEAEMTCIWEQRDTEDATGDTVPDVTAETFPDTQRTDIQASSLAFVSGYTTMEMFQQVNSQVVPSNTSVTREIKPVETDSTEGKSSFDYVRQFSNSPVNSPVFDSTEMSMSPFLKTFWSSPAEHEEPDNRIIAAKVHERLN